MAGRERSSNVSLADIIASTSTVGTRADKLVKFVAALNGTTGYEGRGVQREFYDKALELLDVVFGEGKQAKRSWLTLAEGCDWRRYKATPRAQRGSYSKEQKSRAKAAIALVDNLLNPNTSNQGSFMSLTRVAHRFAFPLSFFPFSVRHCVAAGAAHASPLLRLLRTRNAERGNPPLNVKPMDKRIMLDLFECLVMYLVHYPVSAKRRKRAGPVRQASAQYFDTPTFGAGSGGLSDAMALVSSGLRKHHKQPLLYTDVQRQKLRSPYLTLVWHYLHEFLPSEPDDQAGDQLTLAQSGSAYGDLGAVRSTLSSKGLVLLYAMREFWLGQNPPEVLLQADTLTPQQRKEVARRRGSPGTGASFSVDYQVPTREQLQCVTFMVTYLLADPVLETCLRIYDFDFAAGNVARKPASGTGSVSRLTDALAELHWSLFTFYNINLACCPTLLQPNIFPDVVDSWLAYLTPWRAADRGSGAKELDPAQRALRKRQKKLLDSGVSKINAGINLISGGAYQATPVDHGDDDGGKSSKRPNAWKGDFGNGFYKKADYERVWEPFVVHNYLFYVQLLAQFVKRCNTLDFVSGRKYEHLRMLERVLVVFEPCVVATLEKCAKIIQQMAGQGSRYRTPGRVPGSEWMFTVLQQHVRAVGDQALDARGLPPTLASFKRDAEALLYTLSEADVSQDLEKRRLQSEWANEPIIDRFTAWLWSWFAWMPGAEPDSRTYLAQNDKVIAAFRKRLQQNMKRVRSLFGVTKHVTATSISENLSSSSELTRALAPDMLRERRLRGFLTPQGRQQLQLGLRKTRALDVAHIGAEAHMRPPGTYEVGWVLRLMVRFSRWWDRVRHLDEGDDDHDASDHDAGEHAHHDGSGPLRARVLASRPSPTFARIRPLADLRVMLLLPVTIWVSFHLLRLVLYALLWFLRALAAGASAGPPRAATHRPTVVRAARRTVGRSY